jgi:serine/threonine protein kinase
MSTGRDDHPTLPKAGARIGGYVLGEELGRGGAATVFLATDLKHDRPVALKVLNADTSSALGGDRFKREIDVVAKLHHPHILPLHDSGEVDGLLYYVMPLVTGETLRDRISREGPLPLPDVRRIMNDVAAALDYAHRHGVVHRDVKPANILLDEEHATVADFGIAHRALADSADQLTTVGMIIGTPTYMSPEQSTGSRDIGARTDVYALACVAFEMLAGVPPFRGPSVTAIVAQHLQAPVPSAGDLRAELPSAVDDVLRKALAKDPADRYASARELGAALGDALTTPDSERPVARAAVPAVRRRPRLSIAVAGVMLLAATPLAAYIATRDDGPPSIAVLPFTNMRLRRSDSLDPTSPVTKSRIGSLLYVNRQFPEADSVARKTLAEPPGTQLARLVRARALSALGRHDEAIAAVPTDTLRLGSYEAGVAGYVYARAGQPDRARDAIRALRSRAYVPAEAVAAIYAGLGQIDSAFIWVDSAIASRGVGPILFDREPMYDLLRKDPRYSEKLREIGLGTPGTPRRGR